MRTLLLVAVLFLLSCEVDLPEPSVTFEPPRSYSVTFCAEYVCTATSERWVDQTGLQHETFYPEVVDFCCHYTNGETLCIENIQKGIPDKPHWYSHLYPCDDVR